MSNENGNGTKRAKLVVTGNIATGEFGWRTSAEVEAKAPKRIKAVCADFSKCSREDLIELAWPWVAQQIQSNLRIIAESGGDLDVYNSVDVKDDLMNATRKGGDKLAKAKASLLQLGFSADAIEALLASKQAAGEFDS